MRVKKKSNLLIDVFSIVVVAFAATIAVGGLVTIATKFPDWATSSRDDRPGQAEPIIPHPIDTFNDFLKDIRSLRD